MTALRAEGRLALIALGAEAHPREFAEDVAAGLSALPKRLSCRFFYDAGGSRLFEQICELPEYYLTRAERSILEERAAEIAAALPAGAELIELGSGSSVKTRLLISAFLQRGGRCRYVPIDISRSILEQASVELLSEFQALEVTAVAAEYEQGLAWLAERAAGPRLLLWLGSNVGNLERGSAARFLARLRGLMAGGDRLLIGIDLRKERAVLEAAYDDAAGVTARFNLNLLERINRELGGEFDLTAFRHRARYDEQDGRVEMHLLSARAQQVRVRALERVVAFSAGEEIHTENSYKYSLPEIDALAEAGGLRVDRRWLDAAGLFSLNLLAPRA